jgi:hypothetical protein
VRIPALLTGIREGLKAEECIRTDAVSMGRVMIKADDHGTGRAEGHAAADGSSIRHACRTDCVPIYIKILPETVMSSGRHMLLRSVDAENVADIRSPG